MTETMFTMPVIVVARADGRGGIEPFGVSGENRKGFVGAHVAIGEKTYTVTKDGRVNIPKSVMETGIKGSDGRYRIAIGFNSGTGKNGWKDLKAVVVKPSEENITSRKGEPLKKFVRKRKDLVPGDVIEYNWSSV